MKPRSTAAKHVTLQAVGTVKSDPVFLLSHTVGRDSWILFSSEISILYYTKMFENSFLKNSIIEFWCKAFIVSILKYSANEN